MGRWDFLANLACVCLLSVRGFLKQGGFHRWFQRIL